MECSSLAQPPIFEDSRAGNLCPRLPTERQGPSPVAEEVQAKGVALSEDIDAVLRGRRAKAKTGRQLIRQLAPHGRLGL